MTNLHPAENRGYRELYLTSRHLIHHWQLLHDQFATTEAGAALRGGAEAVRELVKELEPLTASRGVYGRPGAQGGGARLGRMRYSIGDRFLERNQALRFAVLDIEHVTTLLGYLGALAEERGDAELNEFFARWERQLAPHASSVRDAAIAIGRDPDDAIQPVDDSHVGRAAHGAANCIGTFGEWWDRRVAERDTRS